MSSSKLSRRGFFGVALLPLVVGIKPRHDVLTSADVARAVEMLRANAVPAHGGYYIAVAHPDALEEMGYETT